MLAEDLVSKAELSTMRGTGVMVVWSWHMKIEIPDVEVQMGLDIQTTIAAKRAGAGCNLTCRCTGTPRTCVSSFRWFGKSVWISKGFESRHVWVQVKHSRWFSQTLFHQENNVRKVAYFWKKEEFGAENMMFHIGNHYIIIIFPIVDDNVHRFLAIARDCCSICSPESVLIRTNQSMFFRRRNYGQKGSTVHQPLHPVITVPDVKQIAWLSRDGVHARRSGASFPWKTFFPLCWLNWRQPW